MLHLILIADLELEISDSGLLSDACDLVQLPPVR